MFHKEFPKYVYDAKNIQEYWIIFCKSNTFIKHFLKKDFGHVCVLTKDNHNWMLFDPAKTQWRNKILPYTTDENVPRILSNQATAIVKITLYPRDFGRQHKYFGITMCVNHILYYLGLPLCVLTPYGLYKKLLRLAPRLHKPCGIHSIKSVR